MKQANVKLRVVLVPRAGFQMANVSDEILLQWMIKDPSWCLFYHREQVKRLLPAIAKSHIIMTSIENRLNKTQENLNIEKRDSDGKTH